jgi:hypothetical protein
MKLFYTVALFLLSAAAHAQKIDSIFVNLYTDSLKQGTYNYINVDGLFSNGVYMPLDSNDIIFTSSHGKFYGNSLWIDSTQKTEKVRIKVVLRKNQKLCKEFVMYIKRKADDEPLMDNKQYLDKLKKDKKKTKDKSI